MKTTLFLLFFIANTLSFAQSTVKLQIQLFTPDVIGNATLDKDKTLEYLKTLNEIFETQLKEVKGNKEVVLIMTIHNDKTPTFQLGAKPALESADQQKILKAVTKLKAPMTKNLDYSLAIMGSVNDGNEEEIEYSPTLLMPLDKEIESFSKLDLKGKKANFEKWIKEEVLPVIEYYTASVDAQFAGVLSIGKILKDKSYQSSTIEKTLDENSDYWRAILEMSLGNQIILFTKACLYISKGELDKANKILFIVNNFSEDGTLPAALSEEITTKMDLMVADFNEQMNLGIKLHDEKKYKEASAHYAKLLKIVPNAAWLNYEIYFTKVAEITDMNEVYKEWAIAKPKVYNNDPMYPMDIHAKTGKEGYLLFRRNEMSSLFANNDDFKTDIVKYADIALDLGNYAFAAQLYWLIQCTFEKEVYEDRNIMAYFLYCLDKLGDKETIKNFKDELKDEFPKIEKERKKLMEENMIYNSFEVKE